MLMSNLYSVLYPLEVQEKNLYLQKVHSNQFCIIPKTILFFVGKKVFGNLVQNYGRYFYIKHCINCNIYKFFKNDNTKGTRKWSQLVRDQIKRQEIELFKDFKGKINDAVLKEYGNNLDDMLEDHKINLMKRSSIHTENGINGQTLNNIHSVSN